MRAQDHTVAMLAWWRALGIDRADLAVRRPDGSMLWHADMRLERLPLRWARANNVRQADVYVRPARGHDWPLVFLDDVDVNRALKVVAKYAALAVRTSPAGGCHLWLAATRELDERARATAQRWLAARLHADPASVSGEHLGRLAGFKSWKRAGTWVNVLQASNPCRRRWDPAVALAALSCPPRPPRARHLLKPRPADPSPSGREWGWVCRALEAGGDPRVVYHHLVARARVRRGQDTERYARRTLAQALRRTRGEPISVVA